MQHPKWLALALLLALNAAAAYGLMVRIWLAPALSGNFLCGLRGGTRW